MTNERWDRNRSTLACRPTSECFVSEGGDANDDDDVDGGGGGGGQQ